MARAASGGSLTRRPKRSLCCLLARNLDKYTNNSTSLYSSA